jgi:hypothetical protein
MTEDDVRSLLRKKLTKFVFRKGSTGLRAWCRQHGVASEHVSEFLSGVRNPASDMLDALGLEYRIVRKRKNQ